jgi:tetratricopeptide (TPR) repeat protein
VAALLARDERLAALEPTHWAFIDTETTGLAGGSGTYAFLVGIGLFEAGGFTIYQFLMRDYDEEPAQLHALATVLDRLRAVVSFNGKSFDIPLLEARFTMTRQARHLGGAPHLDLLPVSRRIWKHRLESCALSNLEEEVLGVRRTQEDVPGWLIPELYWKYVRSRDARDMPRIFYHNAQDILSLVVLAARLSSLLTHHPLASSQDGDIPGEDLYGLGRLLCDLGQGDRGEVALARSVECCRLRSVRELAMRDLAYLLKRQERRDEALALWQRLAREEGAIYAFEELAKHYEWHARDTAQALAWTEEALALVQGWPPGLRRREALAELQHRLNRLRQRLLPPQD